MSGASRAGCELPSLTVDKLLSELSEERHRQVYLLLGDERFLCQEALAALKSYVFAKSSRDFNYGRYDCADGEIEQALATARTLPMMGSLRLVLLHGIERIADGGAPASSGRRSRRAKRASPLELLEEYLENPEPSSVLVLLADKLDRRRKLARRLEKVGGVVELRSLRLREVPDWIARRARDQGIRLEREVPGILADLVGNDLGNIQQNLEKLSLFAGGERAVTVADLETCVARTKIHAIFEIMDAIGHRRVDRALTLLHRLLQNPEEAPLRVLAVLSKQVRRLWLAHSMLGVGVKKAELAGRIGVRDFVVDDLCRQARLFKRDDFLRASTLLYDTDRALKTTGTSPVRLLELLVLGLCRA